MPILGSLLALLAAARAPKPAVDEAPPGHPSPAPDPDEAVRIDRVGAWVGRAGFSTAAAREGTVRAAQHLGLRRLDLICNDFAAAREPVPFSTYDVADLVDVAMRARAAGMVVHLMSWIMPHARFIDGAAAKLRSLFEATDAASIVWDAEEPWTLARRPLDYGAAAELVAAAFAGIPMGVTGIGYTPDDKFGPLAEKCDVLLPQCYATQTSGLSPETCVPLIMRRWKWLFGEEKRYDIGLAGYRQPVTGYSVESSMRLPFAAAKAEPLADDVVYWSLGAIRKSAAVTAVVRALTGASV